MRKKWGFLIIVILILTACQEKVEEPVVFVEDYLILVNDERVQKEEVMVFVYQVVEEFEDVGGKEVWEFEDFSGGKSAVEVAKEAVLENVVRMKVLNAKSKELNIVLTMEKEEEVKRQAATYFDNMSEVFKANNGVSESLVLQVFLESAIAKEVASEVTEDFIPEEPIIQEKLMENEDYHMLFGLDTTDILTEITVRHILFAVREVNQEGEYVTLTDEQKSIQYTMAMDVHAMAVDGVDFESLALEYGEGDDQEYTFSKALVPEEFRGNLTTLAEGEVSEIIESEQGYHLFKVEYIDLPTEEEVKAFDTNVEAFEESLRENIISQLRDEAFNSLYEEWKQDIVVRLDKEVWDNIDLQID